jgi:hypothetical protein
LPASSSSLRAIQFSFQAGKGLSLCASSMCGWTTDLFLCSAQIQRNP